MFFNYNWRSYFTDMKMEAQGGERTSSRCHSWQVAEQGFEPRSGDLGPPAHTAVQCQFYPFDYIFQPYKSHL